jgi:hypothetical protein
MFLIFNAWFFLWISLFKEMPTKHYANDLQKNEFKQIHQNIKVPNIK